MLQKKCVVVITGFQGKPTLKINTRNSNHLKKIMNQAFLYSKYNGLQKNDATFVLKNYFHLVQWKKDGDDAILDIGCGAGDVTNDLLLPFLPKNFGKLIGADLSEDMVEFARTRYKTSKISFEQMNIEAEDIPVDFEEAFDHVFSFYCLHWIQDQR